MTAQRSLLTVEGARACLCSAPGPTKTPHVNLKIDEPIDRRIVPPPMLSAVAQTVAELIGDWDICQVYASHEKALAWRLLDEGVGYFLPLQQSRRRSGERYVKRILPCIPGYIFLRNPDRFAVRDHLRRHHRRDVLRFMDVISPARLGRELNQIHWAITHRRSIEEMGIKAGRLCRVTDGPLMGSRGVMDRAGKRGWAVLNVSTLGTSVQFEVEIEQLEPINEDPDTDRVGVRRAL